MLENIDHYRLGERLGDGGFGEVYKAEDLQLGRTVAIKFIRADSFSQGTSNQNLLEKEAKTAAAINHPNIATIYELRSRDHRSYIVMEYVAGVTLAEKIRQGDLSIRASLEIAIQATEALKTAHSRGLIHCDLTPSNIMLIEDNRVKVLDFGLARLNTAPRQIPGTTEKSSTDKNTVSGTIGYMSPEQVRGDSLDAGTDLFSLGVVLYEMITGRRPFQGARPAAALHALLNEEPKPLGVFRDDIPLELESIIRKALEKNRANRYRSAAEILSDLRQMLNQIDSKPALGRERLNEDSGERATRERPDAPQTYKERLTSRLPLWLNSYRRWSLTVAVLAVASVGADVLLVHPQGMQWIRDALLLSVSATAFVLYAMLPLQTSKSASSLPKGAAFRGLLPFQEADRDRFYGRDIDISAVVEKIAHQDFHFGVLYGDSGCGKTSLIQAGILPKLREEGYAAIYCRSYKDPVITLLENSQRQNLIKACEGEAASDYFHRLSKTLAAEIVIVFDQFEEFFTNFKLSRERDSFFSFLASLVNDESFLAKVLLSMRSDFLYLVNSELAGKIENPLQTSRLYHLKNFDCKRAKEIIERSARRANLPLEGDLCSHVARDLAVDDRVLPSELQIVGEQLQSKRILTLQEYRQAGGKESLVHNYLEDVIQASGSPETARLLLRSLISDQNTRLTLTLEELCRRTQRSRDIIEPLLHAFVHSRLICEIQEEEPWRYELMHEYLIEKIHRVTGRLLDATQRANHLFRQYLSASALDKAARIPLSKWNFIRKYSDLPRGERERELLKRSLKQGFVKAGFLGLSLTVGSIFFAAFLSVSEEWEVSRLSDGHTAAVRQAVFSPDSNRLVSVGEDGKVVVWDFLRRLPLATLREHIGQVYTVAYAPNGKWFATAGADKTVILWDAVTFGKGQVFHGHQGPVYSLAFSPDGLRLASLGKDQRTILWDTQALSRIREWPFGTEYGNILFLSNRVLLNSHGMGWDVESGKQVIDRSRQTFGIVNFAALSPDRTREVRVGGGGKVAFWDLAREKSLGTFAAHQDHGKAVAFSPDGRWVATGAEDIILWDAATKTKFLRLEQSATVRNLTFSPDGRWLVSAHADGSILVWDAIEHAKRANFKEHSGPVHSVAFSPDGTRLASGSEDRSVVIWNTLRGVKEAVLLGHESRITAVAFSPDGKLVGSSDLAGTSILWDLNTKQLLARFLLHQATNSLVFSPDNHWMVNSHGVFDSAARRQVIDFAANIRGSFYGLAFSRDGRLLAGAATDKGELFLISTDDWQLVEKAGNPEGLERPRAMSFSPDGQWIVSGDTQGGVMLWGTKPLKKVALLGRHAAETTSVAFSPDGKQVVSAGDDQTIALWDVRRRKLISHLGTHTAPVKSVAFSPDGKKLASGEGDGSVRIYTRHRSIWGHQLD